MSRPVAVQRLRACLFCLLTGCLLVLYFVQTPVSLAQTPDALVPADARVLFVENVGQFPPAVRYVALTGDGPVWLTDDAVWLTVVASSAGTDGQVAAPATAAHPAAALRVNLPAAGQTAPFAPAQPAETRLSYLRGTDAWHAAVPVWTQLTRPGFLPGFDLHFASEQGRLTMTLARTDTAVVPASLAGVHLSVDGAQALSLEGGVLVMQTVNGPARLPLFRVDGMPASPHVDGMTVHAPWAPRDSGGVTREVPAAAAEEALLFSTFLGSGDQDQIYDIARAEDGTILATGLTRSLLFPTTPGVVDPNYNGDEDAFVAKFSADGGQLLYATFLGGSAHDYGYNVAVDRAGRAYVAGRTASTDFPTAAAYDATANGSEDLFLARLSAEGTVLDFATYLGGSGLDWGYGLVVDATGAIALAGLTESPDFPVTLGALDSRLDGPTDGFLLRFQPDAAALDFSTFLGGSARDRIYGMATDDAGAFYVTGRTESTDFPVTLDAYDMSFNGAGTYFGDTVGDVFVAKFNSAGDELRYATYLGGTGYDGYFARIAVGNDGEAVVTGLTGSIDFPTTLGVLDETANGGADLFVTRLNALGNGLVFSTYLGGNQDEQGNAIALDARGDAVITGWTRSANFPITPDAVDPVYATDLDGFVAKLTNDGTELLHSTFLGGIGLDTLNAVLTAQEGIAYVGGWSEAADFPTTLDVYDRFFNGTRDGVVAMLDLPARSGGDQTYSLFGRVVDGSSSGLAGISVAVGAASVTTDDDGAFAVRDLPAGVYPVTPQAAGLRFTPSTVSAVLLPDRPTRVYTFLAVEADAATAPFLQWPVRWGPGLEHAQRTDARSGGFVGAWFDHRYPTQARTDDLVLWDGLLRDTPTAPDCFGDRCRDGLDGLEIPYRDPNPDTDAPEPLSIYPAAAGTVAALERTCVLGDTACGGAEGNYVVVAHDNGLFTRYARLAAVAVTPTLTVGTPVSVTAPLGQMGATGRSGSTFLLFTTHRDNGNGRWDGDLLDKPVDPFGWFGHEPDPWVSDRSGSLSDWLWSTPAFVTETVRADEIVVLNAPTGALAVTVPAAALDGDATVRLFPGVQPAPPDATMRSTGLSFSLDIVAWDDDPSLGTAAAVPAQSQSLTVTEPLQLNALLSRAALAHVDVNALAFQRWDAITQTWSPLETTLEDGVATASTARDPDAFAQYDLQAPLLCPADRAEPDDGPYVAQVVLRDLSDDAVSVAGRFDAPDDEDWLRFDADSGSTYTFIVAEAAADLRIDLAVFDRDGLTLLDAVTSETDGASVELLWQAPARGAYFLRLRQTAAATGCAVEYLLLAGSDDVAPQVQFTAPSNNALLTDRLPSIRARVTEQGTGVAEVSMTLNGATVPATFVPDTGELSYTPDTPLDLGSYTATVVAVDRAGNRGEASVRFRVVELSFVYLPLLSR